MLKNISFAVKLNILVLLVLVLLLVGVVFLLIGNTQNLTKEIGGERTAEEVNIIQSRLSEIENELLVDTNFVVSSVSFFQAVGRRDANDTSDIINTANASLGLDDITVVDGDGKRLVDTELGDDNSQENALLETALDGTTLTRLLIEENDGRTEVSMAAAAPVVSTSGNILGAIQMSRHISGKFLESLIFDQHGIHLGLVYDEGIIARSRDTGPAADNVLINDIAFELELVQQAQAGESVIKEELIPGEGGVPHAVAYVPVLADPERSPVVIMIVVELEEIFLFQNRTLLNTIVVFAALTLFALAIIYVNIYRTMIRPLNQLRAITDVMAGGQYDERAPVKTKDEVGQLADAFNGMATAIQQREVSLKQAREEAERASQVKSLFLASVSHELRTPLNAIINLTKFVGLGMYGPVNAEQVDILGKVEARSKHLLRLINDVLDISKIETGSLELFVEADLKIDEIVRSAIETAQNLLPGKPLELVCQVDEGLPRMTGDAQRIQQIILNLLSNACKFTDEGKITVRAYQDHKSIIISIADEGPGIDPSNHELIFEAFWQTRDGLRKGEGTGLGLPISKRLAEAHGGHLWVESELGQGAVFYVSLPLETSLVPTI